ncbi:MAG: hypothetical protein OXI97_11890, partial [Acidimicrobiaceae bacterium]|nr:hypothetical protein [Acidimicrobiaceae bacterium]
AGHRIVHRSMNVLALLPELPERRMIGEVVEHVRVVDGLDVGHRLAFRRPRNAFRGLSGPAIG